MMRGVVGMPRALVVWPGWIWSDGIRLGFSSQESQTQRTIARARVKLEAGHRARVISKRPAGHAVPKIIFKRPSHRALSQRPQTQTKRSDEIPNQVSSLYTPVRRLAWTTTTSDGCLWEDASVPVARSAQALIA